RLLGAQRQDRGDLPAARLRLRGPRPRRAGRDGGPGSLGRARPQAGGGPAVTGDSPAQAHTPERQEEVEALRGELAAVRRREAELRELLVDAHEQLAARDDELVKGLAWPGRMAQQQLDDLRRTRAWRAVSLYWRTRDRLRDLLRLGRRR